MNWFLLARKDWTIYQDSARLKMFVQKEKITAAQFEEITGEAYTP